MSRPLISVVVPARNEAGFLEKCLESVRGQTFWDYELIVVDDGSTDGTAKLAKKHADVVVRGRGLGAGAARNLGAGRAKGEVVAFTDADSTVAGGWLGRISSNVIEGDAGGVFGPVLFGDSKLDNAFAAFYWMVEPALWRVFGLPLAWGSNCAYRRDVFSKVGGFRQDAFPIEDGVCSFEASRLARVKFDPKMMVWTSARRMKGKGSLKTIAEVTRASLQYLLGKKVKTNY